MGVKSLSLLSIYENPSSNRGVCNQQVHGSSPCAGSLSINDLRMEPTGASEPLYPPFVPPS